MSANGGVAPRVLLVSHTGDLGGAERALLRLVPAAAEEFELSLLTMAEGSFPEEARAMGLRVSVLEGGQVVRLTRHETGSFGSLASSSAGVLRLARALRSRIRAEDADLIVANSLKGAVLLSIVAGRRRWVWHLHDRLASDYLPAPAVVAMRLLARIGPRRVVANSRATAATAGRLPRGRVVIAYPGLDEAAFADPKPAPGDGPIGILGRLGATKGQRLFVRAAKEIAESDAHVRFRIVGAALFEDAEYAAALHADIASSGLSDRIEGPEWSDAPSAELRAMSALIHASPVPEPFGQVVVEAMAVGTPVAATDAGGIREIVDPDREARELSDGLSLAPYGLLVRPDDAPALGRAMAWLRRHPDEAAAMAARAHEMARMRFTIAGTWRAVAGAWREGLG